MKKIWLTTAVSFFIICKIYSQTINLYPTNWWVDMKWNKVQLLVRDTMPGFNTGAVTVSYPGVSLVKINRLDNPHYYALDVVISPTAKSGVVKFIFKNGTHSRAVNWPLNKRRDGNKIKFAQGINSADLVYLLMPDRFSNGDPANDKIAGMRDQSLNRDSMYLRHGGDLQGVINHLDYLKDLGVTTVWMTPVLENDMPNRTEHGYAVTNHYKVDPRFGGSEAYKKVSDEIHKRGMKLIQDAVYNHVGIRHFTVEDKPTKDWLHEWPSYTQTTYKDQVLFDPHAAPSQTKQMSDGWFTAQMPDMNQANEYVANFLIQNAIWSVEEFGIDGWRIDTYIYNDLQFMNRCNKALYDEYPAITLFGETWVHGVANQSYFCENILNTKFKSNLGATTDFQSLFYGIQPALNEKFGWTEGVTKLYNTAAQDFLYKDPSKEVIFLDNHDLPRFFSVLGEDTAKYEMALKWLLTFRGIPQMYYGMEILMTGFSNPDGLVRSDFMGGWKSDGTNKFIAAGRTDKENRIFNLIRGLANYRKTSSALTFGKMMQYIPEDGLYIYFRYDPKQTLMCIMNCSDTTKDVNFNKYSDRTKGFTGGREVVTNKAMSSQFQIPAKKMYILELIK